jgi:hypothetical protein
MIKTLLALFALAGTLSAQGTCTLGVAYWHDAAVYAKTDGLPDDIDTLIVPVKTIGCIVQTEKTVLVIFHFVQGVPAGYLAIPKQWVLKVVDLEPKPEVKDVVESPKVRPDSGK